ncbi:PA3715 family protein [Pseudomonas sp. TE3610]
MHSTPRIGPATCCLLALFTPWAHAGCPAPAELSDCRAWPARPELTIHATTAFKADKKADPTGGSGTYDLTLQLENTTTQSTVATYTQPEQWYSDAVGLRKVTLDTARYVLTPTTRAFGLRALQDTQSRATPYTTEKLALFIQQGTTLRPVLDGLVMEDQTGEWDMTNCTGEGAEHHRTVEIGKGVSHGFADLIVRTQTVRMSAVGQPDACDIKSTPEPVEVTTLHYNGSMYRLAAGMGYF